MNSNMKIAREMLCIAKDLVSVNTDYKNLSKGFGDMARSTKDISQKNTYKNLSKSYGNLSKRKSAGDDDDNLSNSTMDKVAEELLQVASELLKNEEE